MKRTAALLLCTFILGGAVSCSRNGGEDEVSVSAPLRADSEEKRNYRLDEFDDGLIGYLCLNGYDSSNFVVSPEAFRASLCIVAEGARGNTRTELLKAVGFSGMDTLTSWYSELNEPIVNTLWSGSDTLGSFNSSYISDAAEKYNADVFSCRSDEMAQAIKEKTLEKTNGMTFDEADSLNGVSSVIISALNLQTAWGEVFGGAEINNGVFVGDNGKEYPMSFAEKTGEYLYAEENGVKVMVVPMENDLSFVCFSGDRTGVSNGMKMLKPETVHVVLPEFELESVFDSKDLFGYLLECGVSDAFNSQTANFYNVCSDGDWFMQEAVQKTRISFDEAAPPKKKRLSDTGENGGVKEFIADRPFSFMVFSDFGAEKQHMMMYGQMMSGK